MQTRLQTLGEEDSPYSVWLVSRLLSYAAHVSSQACGVQLLHATAALAPADCSLGSIAVMRNAFSLGPAGSRSSIFCTHAEC